MKLKEQVDTEKWIKLDCAFLIWIIDLIIDFNEMKVNYFKYVIGVMESIYKDTLASDKWRIDGSYAYQ